MTIAEQLRQQGIEKGVEIGVEKGVGIGVEKGKLTLLLELLEQRFGNVSPIIEKRLRQSDKDTFKKFGASMFDFNDLKDAEKWWDQH